MNPAALPLPPPGTDPNSEQYRRYLLSLGTVTGVFAPTDARYWVSRANTVLTNEQNLGTLASGYLKVVVAAGIAIPSTVTGVPTADITGTVSVTQGGTGSNLSASGGANQVVQQASVGGAFSVSQLSTANISGLAGSTYTPTLTGVANVAASTAYACQYLRVGSVVTVSGKLDLDPTAGATLTQLGISLPIASNFAAAENCGGTAADPTISGYAAAILADAANDRAEMDFTTAVDVANRSWFFSFTYQII